MTAQWQAERDKLAGARDIKEELDQRASEFEIAKREGDLARLGELSYGVIPSWRKQAGQGRRAGEDVMVEEAVRPEQIASVVERWTGIPVGKMLEGERDKLLRMEEEIGKRVIGQIRCCSCGRNAVRRARAGLNDRTARLDRSCSLGQPVWVRPN